MKTLVTFFIVLLNVSISALAQYGAVSGTIRDMNKLPIQNASIEVKQYDSLVAVDTTDVDGNTTLNLCTMVKNIALLSPMIFLLRSS